MSDLAEVGLRFQNEGYDVSARQVDQFTDKTAKAEKAVDGAAGAQKRLSASQMGLVANSNTLTGSLTKQAMAATDLSRSAANAVVGMTGMSRGMGAMSIAARALEVALGAGSLGLIAVVYALIAAFNYFKGVVAEAHKAVDEWGKASATARDALAETDKWLTTTTPRITAFAGEVGVAAQNMWDFAAAQKAAAIGSLMSERANLGKAQQGMQDQTTAGRWQAVERSNPLSVFPAVTGLVASLLMPGTQETLKVGIASTEAQMKDLETRIRELAALDLEAFAKKNGGAVARVGSDAKKSAAELTAAGKELAAFLALQKEQGQGLKKLPTGANDNDIQKGVQASVDKAAHEAIIGWGKAADAAEEAAFKAKHAFQDAARDIAWQFNSVFDDFARKDWMSAFSGLFDAVKSFQAMWAQGGSSKIGAVAGLANSAGQAIGGSAGAGLMGAAGGAMAGVGIMAAATGAAAGTGATALMAGAFLASNPVGWVIGGLAIAGGILGIFGGSKAKKKEQEEQRARDAAEAATRAQEELNQKNEIAIQTMLLLGDAQGSRNLQLEVERAGIAASNLAAFDEMVKLRDAQSLRELNIQLLEAENRTGEATAMRREDALNKLTPAEQELTKQIWAATDATNALAFAQGIHAQAVADADAAISKAQADLTAARNAETQAMREQAQAAAQTAQASRDMWQGFADGLTEFERSIGGQMAGSGGVGYRTASSRFYSNAGRIGTDPDARAQFVELGQALAQSSAVNAVTQIQQLRDLANIRAATEAAKLTAGRQVNVAQAQLDAANAQVAALATINESVLTVAQATANLAAAMGAKANLTGAGYSANDNGAISWGSSSADIERLMATGLIATDGPAGGGPGTADYLLSLYRSGGLDTGSGTYQQFKAAGFARGGLHSGGLRIVGEHGPELESTGPSRIWNADQTAQMLGGDNSEVVAAVDRLGAKVDGLGAKLDKGNSNTGLIATFFRMITRGEPNIYTKAA